MTRGSLAAAAVVTALGALLAAALAAISVESLGLSAVFAAPAAVAIAASVVVDAVARRRRAVATDLAAAATAVALAAAASAVGADAAEIVLGTMTLGGALGYVARSWWSVYLAALSAVVAGLYGLILAAVYLPAVAVGVIARSADGDRSAHRPAR